MVGAPSEGQMYIESTMSFDSIQIVYKTVFLRIIISVLVKLVGNLLFDSTHSDSNLNKYCWDFMT